MAWSQVSRSSQRSPARSRPPRLHSSPGPVVRRPVRLHPLARRARGRIPMRFDPALWLSGATANRAAIEDGVIRPGETVPNDYYIRNESRKQLTYAVPRMPRDDRHHWRSGSRRHGSGLRARRDRERPQPEEPEALRAGPRLLGADRRRSRDAARPAVPALSRWCAAAIEARLSFSRARQSWAACFLAGARDTRTPTEPRRCRWVSSSELEHELEADIR